MSGAAAAAGERLSVVVPFYNEEGNLPRYPAELYPALDALGLPWELILVDDGSKDGSRRVAEELCAREPRARLVLHERNRGLGAAVRTGLAAARGDLVMTLDADLTFHPRQAPALLARLREGSFDLVSGRPVLHGVPWHRAAISRVANLLYQIVLGRRLDSVTPIFRIYRRAALDGIELGSEKFEINAEILAKLLLRGARVSEVDAVLTTRTHGVSKLDNRAEIANHLRLLARIASWRLRLRR